MSKPRVKSLLDQIYDAVAQLERMFPGRKFTPDGIMVGSIGEVLAHQKYNIDLLPQNYKGHDASAAGVGLVQIKTTQGKVGVMLNQKYNHLIVQRLMQDSAEVEEVYNGPGDLAWRLRKNRKANASGQVIVPLGRLKKAQEGVRVRVPER
jgi:hypothetical protein